MLVDGVLLYDTHLVRCVLTKYIACDATTGSGAHRSALQIGVRYILRDAELVNLKFKAVVFAATENGRVTACHVAHSKTDQLRFGIS